MWFLWPAAHQTLGVRVELDHLCYEFDASPKHRMWHVEARIRDAVLVTSLQAVSRAKNA